MSGSRRKALIATGFTDVERAASFLHDPAIAAHNGDLLLERLRTVADPDQALLLFLRLAEKAPHVTPDVALLRVLGASSALGEFLIRHPEHLDVLNEAANGDSSVVSEAGEPGPSRSPEGGILGDVDQLRSSFHHIIGSDAAAIKPQARLDETFTAAAAATALRVHYRRQILRIASYDLLSQDPVDSVETVCLALSDAADAVMDAAVAVSRASVQTRDPDAAQVDLGVLALGKTGARELNYVSDVDVIFLHQAQDDISEDRAAALAAELAHSTARVIDSDAGEPALWEVDANLRPEGKDGALSRSLHSHMQYYRRWAQGWEFQALLKARPMAGDRELAQRLCTQLEPLVWNASTAEGFVSDVHQMRARVYANIGHQQAPRNIKLGRGGLREVEFTVQLLQMVHGRTDETLRVRSTLDAISALSAGEYISLDDASAMRHCYRQLRLIEHRIQLRKLRRSHLVPSDEATLRVLARAMRPRQDFRGVAAEDFTSSWERTSREVAQFHQRVFYRPLISHTAALAADDIRLSADKVRDRLAVLGYRDPNAALNHIDALSSGVSRRAIRQRHILPVMLGWFAQGVNPDSGLLAFRRLSESLGSTPWFLTMLRDSSVAAQRLCFILSSSRFIAETLEHSPESVRWLDNDDALKPVPAQTLLHELTSSFERHSHEPTVAVRLGRLMRQREMLRTAIGEACGLVKPEEASQALAEADRIATLGALRATEQEVFADSSPSVDFAIIAMGRQGGRESTYGTDLDVMFVHRRAQTEGQGSSAEGDVDAQALVIAKRVTGLISAPLRPAIRGEIPLSIDAALRPEGKSGPLSRSLDSYASYYQRWMEPWERQALLRARFLTGSDTLGADFKAVIDPIRYGRAPTVAQLRQIRRIKARVESERLPRGADPARHIKLGRGGLSDVEWLVQLYQLQYADRHKILRSPSTMTTLNALVDTALVDPADAELLAAAWTLCQQVRSGLMLYQAKLVDVLPSDRRSLDAVARWCGFHPGEGTLFEDHYLATTRRSRQVFERLFYDVDPTS